MSALGKHLRELEAVKDERDKLVNFARIHTDKLHIAIKALEEIRARGTNGLASIASLALDDISLIGE